MVLTGPDDKSEKHIFIVSFPNHPLAVRVRPIDFHGWLRRLVMLGVERAT